MNRIVMACAISMMAACSTGVKPFDTLDDDADVDAETADTGLPEADGGVDADVDASLALDSGQDAGVDSATPDAGTDVDMGLSDADVDAGPPPVVIPFPTLAIPPTCTLTTYTVPTLSVIRDVGQYYDVACRSVPLATISRIHLHVDTGIAMSLPPPTIAVKVNGVECGRFATGAGIKDLDYPCAATGPAYAIRYEVVVHTGANAALFDDSGRLSYVELFH